jgi:hypothetical protein
MTALQISHLHTGYTCRTASDSLIVSCSNFRRYFQPPKLSGHPLASAPVPPVPPFPSTQKSREIPYLVTITRSAPCGPAILQIRRTIIHFSATVFSLCRTKRSDCPVRQTRALFSVCGSTVGAAVLQGLIRWLRGCPKRDTQRRKSIASCMVTLFHMVLSTGQALPFAWGTDV